MYVFYLFFFNKSHRLEIVFIYTRKYPIAHRQEAYIGAEAETPLRFQFAPNQSIRLEPKSTMGDWVSCIWVY